jgi:hypothetical protein
VGAHFLIHCYYHPPQRSTAGRSGELTAGRASHAGEGGEAYEAKEEAEEAEEGEEEEATEEEVKAAVVEEGEEEGMEAAAKLRFQKQLVKGPTVLEQRSRTVTGP